MMVVLCSKLTSRTHAPRFLPRPVPVYGRCALVRTGEKRCTDWPFRLLEDEEAGAVVRRIFNVTRQNLKLIEFSSAGAGNRSHPGQVVFADELRAACGIGSGEARHRQGSQGGGA